MKKYFLLLLVILVSCQSRPKRPQNALPSVGSTGIVKGKTATGKAKPTLNYFFADSTGIGRKLHNKIEMAWYSSPDSDFVVGRFYTKQHEGWRMRNEFKRRTAQYLDPYPEISDLNGDGYNDITYASLRAARGANDVRKLFIYDQQNDSLVYVRNSEDFPNMQYNKQLHCIDALLVSGCWSTVFLKLEKDTLREFASVDRCDSLIVNTYDRQGKAKIILTKKADQNDFVRYKNYRPLEEADE